MLNAKWMAPTLLVLVSSLSLGGCFYTDNDDHRYGSAPVVRNSGDTFYFCDYDPQEHDYYWEYQAEVHDADGLGDIYAVDVTFYHAFSGAFVDRVDLFEEAGGIWGAWSWERETQLFCGDDYEVVFYVEDYDGNSDSLTMGGGGGGNQAPVISESPADTYADCYEDAHDWVFEFQAHVGDVDGFEDVSRVKVTFVDTISGYEAGVYDLNFEGGGYWGGWIEEGNGNALYCGDSYDVIFYAEDSQGNWDSFSYYWN